MKRKLIQRTVKWKKYVKAVSKEYFYIDPIF